MNVKLLILGALALIVAMGVLMLRKEFPYEIEVVPSNNSIWVINTTDWADRDCTVAAENENGQYSEALLPAKTGIVKLDGLKNKMLYTISVRRNDILGRIKYRASLIKAVPDAEIRKYIVLVGASVGKSWDLPGLSGRKQDTHVFYGYRGIYTFDKSKIIKNLIRSPLKPAAVIIKECAAYFPREINPSVDAVKEWAQMLRSAGIQPILATVVPVTEAHDIERKEPRMPSINIFNEAVRSICIEENIPLLDLQQILSNKKNGNYLDERYAVSDGLHLRVEAYSNVLDSFLIDFIHLNLLK